MKQYNDLSDTEKKAIRTYESWRKSDAPYLYKLGMLELSFKVLQELGIQHIVINRVN